MFSFTGNQKLTKEELTQPVRQLWGVKDTHTFVYKEKPPSVTRQEFLHRKSTAGWTDTWPPMPVLRWEEEWFCTKTSRKCPQRNGQEPWHSGLIWEAQLVLHKCARLLRKQTDLETNEVQGGGCRDLDKGLKKALESHSWCVADSRTWRTHCSTKSVGICVGCDFILFSLISELPCPLQTQNPCFMSLDNIHTPMGLQFPKHGKMKN